MVKKKSDLDEYQTFVLAAAQSSARKVENRVDVFKGISNKPGDAKAPDEVKANKSKCDLIEEAKQAAFIICLFQSKQVFTQKNQF